MAGTKTPYLKTLVFSRPSPELPDQLSGFDAMPPMAPEPKT